MTGRERVQVFVTETGVPKILDGWLTSVEDTTYTVELSEGVDVAGQVVLNFPDSDRERVMTRLEGSDGGRFRFAESQRVAPDKRNYPRLYAGLKVLYRVSGASDWFETDEYMNFSVSGLAFDGSGSVEDGSNIDLAISIAGEDGEWTALGKVIRCEALPVEEQHELVSGATTAYSLAVSFVSLPDDCREALEELTLRLLDV